MSISLNAPPLSAPPTRGSSPMRTNMTSASGGAVLVSITRSGSSTNMGSNAVQPTLLRTNSMQTSNTVPATMVYVPNDGSSSPREIDRLRNDPRSWLSKLEAFIESRVHVSFLREVRSATETTPQPFLGFNKTPVVPSPANDLERVQRQLDAMRRVEAFLEVKGHIVKSPKKCYTFAEAVESAAFECLKKYATEGTTLGINGSSSNTPRTNIAGSEADPDNDVAMRSSSSPALSTSSGSSAPTTPRSHFLDTSKPLNASNESVLRMKPQRRSKHKNNL